MKIIRYLIGVILGILLITMGRYKIHAYHIIILLAIACWLWYDLGNKKV